MKIPTDLIQKVQYEYVSAKYKDGVFTFPSLDGEVIAVAIKSFLQWAEDKGKIHDDQLDLSFMKKW
jgi:hypothetical protein